MSTNLQTETQTVLELRDLSVEFEVGKKTATVVENMNITVDRGETLCLVGESGCGKSMTALAIMGLMPELGRYRGGRVLLKGRNLVGLDEHAMRRVRGNEISMIFQEPMTALNPVYTVGDQIAEPLRLHQKLSREEARERAIEMLKAVEIPAPERRIREFPHQLSGGMRQRVMIAIALACNPDVLIADEPTTALDVTVQAQIFDLLRKQQEERGTAIIMITHDMGAVSELADRVVVMYGGHAVEEGATDEILASPKHPYTQGLIACLPELEVALDVEREDLLEIPGIVPSVWDRGEGCPFADRCFAAMPKCTDNFPPRFKTGETQHTSCWLYEEEYES